MASFAQQVRTLPANFWYANVMETFERLAFFSVSAIRALFIVAAVTDHGLGLSFTQKGWILSVWALLQCLIPMVSGGYADRYGYRKSLAVAFTINVLGYLLMARSPAIAASLAAMGLGNAAFWVILAASCCVATGTAIFKPPVHGTIARVTTEETSSLGWGIFYWVVNVGGAIAPMTAAWLRGEHDWQNVFYFAGAVTALNFLPAFLLYREPPRATPSDPAAAARSPFGVFADSILNIFRDLRLVAFLLIFSCFWLMFMQLFDLLPNFIEEWVNTSDVAGFFGAISRGWVLPNGQTKPEIIVNIDAISIVLLVIPISWLIGRMNKVAAMILGMLIALVGFVGAGMTTVGWFCCLMIFVFAIGEMICSPTFSAYVGLIAPPDRKALYMGYSNIPFAIGWALGNLVSGYMYEHLGSRANLARRWLVEHANLSSDIAQKLPGEHVLAGVADVVRTGSAAGLHEQVVPAAQAVAAGAGSPDAVTAALQLLAERAGPAGLQQATQTLWHAYHPQMVWVYLGAMGLAGTLGMILFYVLTVRRSSGPSPSPAV